MSRRRIIPITVDAEWLKSMGGKYQPSNGCYSFFSPWQASIGKEGKKLWLDVHPDSFAQLIIVDSDRVMRNSSWFIKKITRSKIEQLCKIMGIRFGAPAVRWVAKKEKEIIEKVKRNAARSC